MVEDWVGAEAFQRGIRRYLREHAMGNATTADFEKDMEEETQVKVTPVIEEMLNRTGYPLMRFQVQVGKLLVDQEPIGGEGVWTMPICVHSEKLAHMCEVVSTAHAEIPLDAIAVGSEATRNSQGWVWTNANGSGYYRSALDVEMLDTLISRGYTGLNEAERLNLLIDVRAKN
jgi:aminopeptidase N